MTNKLTTPGFVGQLQAFTSKIAIKGGEDINHYFRIEKVLGECHKEIKQVVREKSKEFMEKKAVKQLKLENFTITNSSNRTEKLITHELRIKRGKKKDWTEKEKQIKALEEEITELRAAQAEFMEMKEIEVDRTIKGGFRVLINKSKK